MIYHFYLLLLLTKLVIKNERNKKMGEKVTGLELQCYYKQLRKKEKSMLLKHLMVELGYSFSGIRNKFTGKSEFNMRDLALITPIYKSESWRA